MRTVAVALVALLAISAINAQSGTTTVTTTCTNANGVTCGSCSKVQAKLTIDMTTTANSKLEMTCTECSNGKTPSGTAITYSGADATKSGNTADFSSRCFGSIKAFSVIAALVALFFHSF